MPRGRVQLEHAHHLRESLCLFAQISGGALGHADDRRVLLRRFPDLRDGEVHLLDWHD